MRKFLLIPYGDEIEFYQKTIELWRARTSNSQDWTIITYRLTPELDGGQFRFDGQELLIAEHSGISTAIKSDAQGFSVTGKWSAHELLHFIYRRIMLSRFLLHYCDTDLVAYFVTSTSVINLNLLNSVDFCESKHRYVAGQHMQINFQGTKLWFPSGSGFITNRIGVTAFAEQKQLMPIYDDVWSGIMLKNFVRMRFPRLDLIHPNSTDSTALHSYLRRIESAFLSGIWHIRLKLQDNRVTDTSLEDQLQILREAHRLASEVDCASFKTRLLLYE